MTETIDSLMSHLQEELVVRNGLLGNLVLLAKREVALTQAYSGAFKQPAPSVELYRSYSEKRNRLLDERARIYSELEIVDNRIGYYRSTLDRLMDSTRSQPGD